MLRGREHLRVMKCRSELQLDRRSWIRLSASALLALGLWPGRLRGAENGRGGSFRFVVLNDAHFQSPRCPGWFDRVRASIAAQDPKPELCLVAGDLSEHGTSLELGQMRDVLKNLGMEWRAVIGNHDYAAADDRSPWDELFPKSLNYGFEHKGWNFIGLDSTEKNLSEKTRIQAATLQWLDGQLSKFDRQNPTVVFTHFPLGERVVMRPLNGDELLARFRDFNLAAVYCGHFHGFTERKRGDAILTTNRCCSISRGNHDFSPQKGYFLCTAREGKIEREFVEVKVA